MLGSKYQSTEGPVFVQTGSGRGRGPSWMPKRREVASRTFPATRWLRDIHQKLTDCDCLGLLTKPWGPEVSKEHQKTSSYAKNFGIRSILKDSGHPSTRTSTNFGFGRSFATVCSSMDYAEGFGDSFSPIRFFLRQIVS